MNEVKKLNAATIYFEAIGCWGMAEALRKITTGMLDDAKIIDRADCEPSCKVPPTKED